MAVAGEALSTVSHVNILPGIISFFFPIFCPSPLVRASRIISLPGLRGRRFASVILSSLLFLLGEVLYTAVVIPYFIRVACFS